MSVTGLRTGWVVRFDGRQHVMWRHGEVVFAGDLILFVGRDYPGPVDCWVDYDEALIGPGFIDLDALDDVDSTVLTPEKGPVEWMGRLWSQEYLDVGPRDAYSPGQEIFKYRYAFSRLIRNGVTTAMPINSMFYRRWAEGKAEFAGVAEESASLGLRTYLGPYHMSGMGYLARDGGMRMYWDEARGLAGLDEAMLLVDEH